MEPALSEDQAAKKARFDVLAKNFSHMAYVSSKNGPDDEESSSDSDKPPKRIRGIRKSQREAKMKLRKKKKVEESQMSMVDDPNQIDLISNLNLMKMISVSEAFDKFPSGKVDVETFINIMKEVLSDTQIVRREAFVSEMVDLFFRAKSDEKKHMQFEDFTTYLIEHEIDGSEQRNEDANMYTEANIRDSSTHNYIGQIYYMEELDKILMCEQGMKLLRVFDGSSMKLIRDIKCEAAIL